MPLHKNSMIRIIATGEIGRVVQVIDRFSNNPLFVITGRSFSGTILASCYSDELIEICPVTLTPLNKR